MTMKQIENLYIHDREFKEISSILDIPKKEIVNIYETAIAKIEGLIVLKRRGAAIGTR